MLRDAKSLKREALKPGVAELKSVFVCSTLKHVIGLAVRVEIGRSY